MADFKRSSFELKADATGAGCHLGDFVLNDTIEGHFDDVALTEDVAGIPFPNRFLAIGSGVGFDGGGRSGGARQRFGKSCAGHGQKIAGVFVFCLNLDT